MNIVASRARWLCIVVIVKYSRYIYSVQKVYQRRRSFSDTFGRHPVNKSHALRARSALRRGASSARSSDARRSLVRSSAKNNVFLIRLFSFK